MSFASPKISEAPSLGFWTSETTERESGDCAPDTVDFATTDLGLALPAPAGIIAMLR